MYIIEITTVRNQLAQDEKGVSYAWIVKERKQNKTSIAKNIKRSGRNT
jgi:hypothetical protein